MAPGGTITGARSRSASSGCSICMRAARSSTTISKPRRASSAVAAPARHTVGSAQDVARSLRKYEDLGISHFVLSDTPYLTEISDRATSCFRCCAAENVHRNPFTVHRSERSSASGSCE